VILRTPAAWLVTALAAAGASLSAQPARPIRGEVRASHGIVAGPPHVHGRRRLAAWWILPIMAYGSRIMAHEHPVY
jgi:hypothetical protein